MTKAELVEEVARAAELNKRDAEVIVETVFDSIIGALHNGEKVPAAVDLNALPRITEILSGVGMRDGLGTFMPAMGPLVEMAL